MCSRFAAIVSNIWYHFWSIQYCFINWPTFLFWHWKFEHFKPADWACRHLFPFLIMKVPLWYYFKTIGNDLQSRLNHDYSPFKWEEKVKFKADLLNWTIKHPRKSNQNNNNAAQVVVYKAKQKWNLKKRQEKGKKKTISKWTIDENRSALLRRAKRTDWK